MGIRRKRGELPGWGGSTWPQWLDAHQRLAHLEGSRFCDLRSESRWLGPNGNNLSSTDCNDDWVQNFTSKHYSLRVWINALCMCFPNSWESLLYQETDIFINLGQLLFQPWEYSSIILKSEPLRPRWINTFITGCFSFPTKWVFNFFNFNFALAISSI